MSAGGRPRLLDLLPLRFRDRIEENHGCWEWLGWRNDLGYGYIYWQGRDRPAHRIVYELVHGLSLERNVDIDHLCRNPGCVNPTHLEAVSHRENIKRGKAATKMSCKYGHDWNDPRNVYVRANGRRWCAACARERWSHAARKARAAA